MCSRHTRQRPSVIRQAYANVNNVSFARVEAAIEPRYNIGPRQTVIGIASDAPQSATWLSWGLLPGWAKEWKDGSRCINAQAEGLATKPSFRSAWKHARRCVILADGYIEWQTRDGKKVPYLFELPDGAPFGFAGLWEDWTRPEGDPKAGEMLRTATIITCDANLTVRRVNDRMPVILEPGQTEQWLKASNDEAAAMLKPVDEERITYREVNPRINAPPKTKNGHDDPECLESPAPVTAPPP